MFKEKIFIDVEYVHIQIKPNMIKIIPKKKKKS